MIYLIILSIFLSGCSGEVGELLNLSREYTANIAFFERGQKDLCPKRKDYNFVSESECNRAGQEVITLVSSEKEIAVPIRNTAQDAHNDRMYELEQERLRQERQRNENQQKQAERQRRVKERNEQRQAERKLCQEKRKLKCDNNRRYCLSQYTQRTDNMKGIVSFSSFILRSS